MMACNTYAVWGRWVTVAVCAVVIAVSIRLIYVCQYTIKAHSRRHIDYHISLHTRFLGIATAFLSGMYITAIVLESVFGSPRHACLGVQEDAVKTVWNLFETGAFLACFAFVYSSLTVARMLVTETCTPDNSMSPVDLSRSADNLAKVNDKMLPETQWQEWMDMLRSGLFAAFGGLVKSMMSIYEDRNVDILGTILNILLAFSVGAMIGHFLPNPGAVRDGALMVSGLCAYEVLRELKRRGSAMVDALTSHRKPNDPKDE